jgi:hypothetical protein
MVEVFSLVLNKKMVFRTIKPLMFYVKVTSFRANLMVEVANSSKTEKSTKVR